MKKINTGAVGIESGQDVIFEDFKHGGKMWTDTGPREARKEITFSEAYKSVPVIQCSLTLWDVDSSTNVRSDLQAEKVTTQGFELVFRTWGDTKVARVRASWMAIGEVISEDDWQLY